MANNEVNIVAWKECVDNTVGEIARMDTNGGLNLPVDYSVANALQAAFLILQETKDRNKNLALAVCSQESIRMALLKMCTMGLNPQKKQAYFIVYGGTLECQVSYFGNMALAKRFNPQIADISAQAIYESDSVSINIANGKKQVSSHEQSFSAPETDEVVGAYCVMIGHNGEILDTVVMTMKEIHASWDMAKAKPFENGKLKPGSVHAKFTAGMACRTVINKACKPCINSSSDAVIMLKAVETIDVDTDRVVTDAIVDQKANTKMIDFQGELLSPGGEAAIGVSEPVATEDDGFAEDFASMVEKEGE